MPLLANTTYASKSLQGQPMLLKYQTCEKKLLAVLKIVTESQKKNLGASKYCASKWENVWRVSPIAVQNIINPDSTEW